MYGISEVQALGKGHSTHRLRTTGLQEAGVYTRTPTREPVLINQLSSVWKAGRGARMKSSAAESNEGQPGFVRFCMCCPGGVGGEAREFSEWCVCVGRGLALHLKTSRCHCDHHCKSSVTLSGLCSNARGSELRVSPGWLGRWETQG